MGSRYGGLKQLDGLGPNGETIMDYSIYDAIQAGFGKVVWVIRKDFEEQFRTQILSKYEDKIPCELCFQGLDALPEGFTVPEGRVKPWGTNHAVLMGKDVIKEPFLVINCDDFYNIVLAEIDGKPELRTFHVLDPEHIALTSPSGSQQTVTQNRKDASIHGVLVGLQRIV